MATSSPVTAGSLATATQYNDLRTDVLTTHVHDGTNGAVIAAGTPVGPGTASAPGTATAYARTDHVHGISSASTAITANVTLSVAGTVYSVATLSLGAGTWLVRAHVTLKDGGSSVPAYAAYLDNNGGGTWWASAQATLTTSTTTTLALGAVIVLGSTTTVRLAAAGTSASFSAGTAVAQLPTMGQSANVATRMDAVKIG